MTTQRPDLVTLNLSLDYNRETPEIDYRQYVKDRETFPNPGEQKMGKLYNTDKESAPYRYALTGIQEVGVFSKAFFSIQNMEWLHSNIRFKVYELSPEKTVISKQKDSELLETMRRIYLEHSLNPDKPRWMKKEIARLNQLVLEDVVPRIINEIRHYKQYLVDINKIRSPISLPMNTSVTGTKLYERGPADVLGLDVYTK